MGGGFKLSREREAVIVVVIYCRVQRPGSFERRNSLAIMAIKAIA